MGYSAFDERPSPQLRTIALFRSDILTLFFTYLSIRRAGLLYHDSDFCKATSYDDVALIVLTLIIIVFRIPMIFAIQIFALTIPHQFSAKRTPRTIIHRRHGYSPSFQFPIDSLSGGLVAPDFYKINPPKPLRLLFIYFLVHHQDTFACNSLTNPIQSLPSLQFSLSYRFSNQLKQHRTH